MSLYVGSNVKIVDRTGAKSALIICLFKNRRFINVAQTIKSVCKKAIQKTSSGKRLAKKGFMYNIVLVKQKKALTKLSGNQIFFKSSGAVLLNKEDGSLSYRIMGPVSIELRFKYSKTLSFANYNV